MCEFETGGVKTSGRSHSWNTWRGRYLRWRSEGCWCHASWRRRRRETPPSAAWTRCERSSCTAGSLEKGQALKNALFRAQVRRAHLGTWISRYMKASASASCAASPLNASSFFTCGEQQTRVCALHSWIQTSAGVQTSPPPSLAAASAAPSQAPPQMTHCCRGECPR